MCLGGFLADLVASKGQYKSEKELGLAYILYMGFIAIGGCYPIYLFRDYYIQYCSQTAPEGSPMSDPAYWVDSLSVFTTEALMVIIITTLVGAVVGAYTGFKLYRKHFEKAGVV